MTDANADPDAPAGVPLSLRWDGEQLWLLDQRRLPDEVVHEPWGDAEGVYLAIREMRVRGAPAIGIAAAFGLVLAMKDADRLAGVAWMEELETRAAWLKSARPTAVNLAWAVDRLWSAVASEPSARGTAGRRRLVEEATAILEEDRAICHGIGTHGLPLLKDGARVLTHCNAGSLAVSAWGTALAPIYRAVAAGRSIRVYADETRPVLQGARLTAFELQAAGVDVTLITDSMAAHMMATGEIDLVIVGTDRVTANGDVVNKIGTLGVAILAKYFDIPFWVACPSSTWDPDTATGAEVEIEERSAAEVTHVGGRRIAAAGVRVRNPAFDVTPAALVSGIITERGIARAPFASSLAELLGDTRR
ncbi:MAG TPA: S-methyl-5-thioribose-1-phosphate isomerase [Pseudomonadales bacterium]|nr:S-methyl-5-thioribose-1-phosphate isomerase [Pseudomonadales bacterium]